jgi:hypothetical protein
MKALCTLAVFAVPLGLALLWMNFQQAAPSMPGINRLPIQFENLTGLTLVMGFLVSLIPTGVALYGVIRLRRMFTLCSEGKIFTGENVKCVRDFAWSLFGYAVLSPITVGLLSVVLTYDNPPGQRALAISISSNDIQTLFISAIFLVIAWIMVEGRKLADENAQII